MNSNDKLTLAKQDAGKTYDQYREAKQEWVQLGLTAINRWGEGVVLQQAIAEVLEEAYALGRAGTPPVYTPPEAPIGVIRRTRAAPEPAPAVIRRSRPEPAKPPVFRRTR